jgi:hypothetical protein
VIEDGMAQVAFRESGKKITGRVALLDAKPVR